MRGDSEVARARHFFCPRPAKPSADAGEAMLSCPIARRSPNTHRVNPFAIPNFRAFFAARVAANVASAMLVIVIGWQVYDIARLTMSTKDAAFLLGMIGLAQFLPLFALTLVVGYVADRVDRRYIARAATAQNNTSAVAARAMYRRSTRSAT